MHQALLKFSDRVPKLKKAVLANGKLAEFVESFSAKNPKQEL